MDKCAIGGGLGGCQERVRERHRSAREPVLRDVSGIILAGTHVWGENALDRVIPRPLVPVGGRPLVCHILSWMASGGLRGSTICANSDTALFRECLGDGQCFGIDVSYAEDTMPRGPAGCVRDAMAQSPGSTFVVVEGATLPTLDLDELVGAHRAAKAALTMVVRPGSNGAHPGPPLGVYVVEAEAIRKVPEHGFQDIKERLIPDLYKAGCRVEIFAAGAGTPLRVTDAASYLAVNSWATERLVRDGGAMAGCARAGAAAAQATSRVAPSARLLGPLWIGPRSVIGPGAIVIGPTSIGADCEIGAGAVVSRSALWDRCDVGDRSIVDHSIVTVDASVASEAVLRNSVCVSPSQPGRPMIDWLISRCWAAPDPVCSAFAVGADSRLTLAS